MIKPLFEKVLVANRGEIAIRIMKTLKLMNIKAIAVYSEADTNALHVKYADEAYYIGPSSASESYLSIKNIISAIRESGAAAVHPGYGFLSENASFANSLKREGVTLIGPSSHAIKKMGDKIEAKKIAIESGVSTVPGYMGVIKSVDKANSIAASIGYPVIVKAAAGGGGRGMRVVHNDHDMIRAFNSATLEAENSFNDARVFIEKFITRPRHIEIQVIADQHGNVVCLGERECSIQRHHQKIIEEAPSPFIDERIRQIMYEQVKQLVHKVGYYSAGTVEFIMDADKNFYFLEMNTRLQVEHCVTELITGVDIVREMINIAAGEKLSIKQEDVKFNGWAIESRICAEDPSRSFLPSSGRITEYHEPIKSSGIRIDSGVKEGTEVSMFYDSLIAKLCSHGATRQEAIDKMKQGLSSYIIRGISHNISFCEAVMNHPKFIEGNINTCFIEEEYPKGFVGATLTSESTEVFLATAIYIFISEQRRALNIRDQIIDSVNKLSTRWIVSIDNNSYPVFIKSVIDGFNIRQGKTRIHVRSNWVIGNRLFKGEVNGRSVNVKIEHITSGYLLNYSGTEISVYVRLPRISELEAIMQVKKQEIISDEILAPLSGNIISMKVKEGETITEGQELFILAAMKMENIIYSERTGILSKLHVKEGENVHSGQVIMEFV